MKKLHPRHYDYFIIIIIMFSTSFLRPLVERGMIKEEDFNYYKILIFNFILPLGMIIATCLNVEIDIVKNKNKRLDYKFSYFVFIPLIIIIFLYAYSKSNF